MLQGGYIYWSGLFRLPSKTIKALESLFASFLWSEPDGKSKMHLVSWKRICKPKFEGGMDIKRIKDMNKAKKFKLIWHIASGKDNLWMDWVKKTYLQVDSIRTVKSTSSCSWVWRAILMHRQQFSEKFIIKVGNGGFGRLWLDPWHLEGILGLKYGSSIIVECGFPKVAVIQVFIEDGTGCLRPFYSLMKLRKHGILFSQFRALLVLPLICVNGCPPLLAHFL
ncbi:hypothetical protein NE237_010354 [Protea cynaroides]|uniref:Uncharacterized protein n=1 Tax=Protea cynaroides TaxID=273540 RepID=A0A9Q0R1H4_9MAGN|nr:hypothetical protein NE237_010354 [Protea cynaroides]